MKTHKSKPTLGPWEAKDQWGYIKIHSSEEGVCVIQRMDHKGKANAHLISAAPDLLQVAKDYVLLCQLHGTEGAVLDSALSAIAKAEGLK